MHNGSGAEFAGKVVLVGAGRMGGALANAWLDTELLSADSLVILEPNPETARKFRDRGVTVVDDWSALDWDGVEAVVIAVKPQMFAEVIGPHAEALADRLLISIAAGLDTATLQRLVPSGRWVRVMPNQPATVRAGVSGMYTRSDVSASESEFAADLFEAVGEVVRLDDEELMHGLTALSGSGPAFVAYFAEAMIAAGYAEGLSDEAARALALQTIAGAAAQMLQQPIAPADLRAAVSSPGGTTVAGLDRMAGADVFNGLVDGIRAAAQRSRELAKG